MSGSLPAVVRECDVPSVIAGILGVHRGTALELLDRHGRPRSFGFRGRRYVAEYVIREWLTEVATAARCGHGCGQG